MTQTTQSQNFILLLLFLFFVGCSSNRKTHEEAEIESIVEPDYLYGIAIDSLDVEIGTVGKNQFLADILSKRNVSYNVIDHIAKRHKEVFDVRKMRVGNNYIFLSTRDSVPKPLYFVYEIDNTNYVVFGLTDSLPAWCDEKEVVVKIETASGIINSSLWNSMVVHGYDPNLANRLSEIYAWTIDFFGIQKGDRYDVIFERLYCEDKPIGFGKVIASRFNHNKNELFAFYYVQNEKGDFFDEKGQSLMRTFLKAPLKYSRISSTFSNSRRHPVLKISRPHHGVDYAAPSGTPVYAIGDGVVTKKGYQKNGGGNYLYIKHNGTYTTAYMHLKNFAKGIEKGTRVRQGQLIGHVGSTGLSTGPHLDFRFFKNNKPVDPLKVESPPATPIHDTLMEQFKKDIEPLILELQQLKATSDTL
ncbi:MAG: peptidoglycan DD-metalloendopeptidase family protein [Lentimicrobiaceae bacterium]|nr:peptidoglycan DD-metalloendopeptidase family protein [Lentimicrobiaceae bacterium]